MDEIFMYPENDYRSYLEHHGVSGQKWGVRNAGWYPIAAFRAASDKVGTKVHEFKQKRAAEKKRKQRVANLKKAREIKAQKEKEAKDFEAEKKRILTSGTPGEVVKLAPRLSDKEVQDAMLRNNNLEKLRDMEKRRIKDVKDAEFNAKWGKFDEMAKTVGKLTDYANTAKNAFDAVNNLKKFFSDDDNSKNSSQQNNQQNQKKQQPQNNQQNQQQQNSNQQNQNQQNKKQQSKDQQNQQQQNDNQQNQKQETWHKVDNPKNSSSSDDYEQRGEFKSRVVDGDWREVVNPSNVSTAINIANRAMDYYDSAKSSRAVSNGMRLLEDSNYTNLLLEDKHSKR